MLDLFLLLSACHDSSSDSTGESDADTDADSDTDTDTDTDASIYDIQSGKVPPGAVRVVGVRVTGLAPDGAWVEDPQGGPYSGLYAYTATDETKSGLEIGDEVTVRGIYEEHLGNARVDTTQGGALTFTSSASPIDVKLLNVPLLMKDEEQYEGVLLLLGKLITVASAPDADGEFTVDEGLVVDDQMMVDGWATDITPGDTMSAIVGVLAEESGTYKLEPRSWDDLWKYQNN